jgi:predicted N-formylglutamate amidohydrolase
MPNQSEYALESQPGQINNCAMTGDTFIITCEHGGNHVPPAYAPLFLGHEALLNTHRGWDLGALELATQMADAINAPLFAATTTRLLIDLNRSIGHRQLHSEATRHLPLAARRAIATQHYRPHRDAVETEVARRIAAGRRVVHIASHSFTPELHGVVRQADVGFLYDPRRAGERPFASRWLAALKRLRPDLKLRRNYPYEGKGDGLTALLRKRHGANAYVGMELEVNQRFFEAGGPAWTALCADITRALAEAVGGVAAGTTAGAVAAPQAASLAAATRP